MTDILQEMVSILVSGVESMASGIAKGLNAMASDLFIDSSGDTKKLTTFGGIVCVFAGVSLAVSLTTLITRWIMSLGARN